MRGRALWFVGCLAVAATSFAPRPALAQGTIAPASSARDAALRALARRLDLPLVDEALDLFSTQLRRTLPTYFVASVGRNANLGPQWRRGDPTFDEAVRRVDAALAAEEARGGPLLKLDRDDLLSAVDVPWSMDDIAFVGQTLDTPLGREAERAIDAKGAEQAIATLRRRVQPGPERDRMLQAFADLAARAQSQFADASLTLLAMKGADPARAQRLQRLVEGVTVAPSDAIGQRVVDRLSQRLLDAATGQLSSILGGVPVP